MKYIMFNINHSGMDQRVPVIFPNVLIHRRVSSQLIPLLRESFPDTKVTVVSAGDYNQSTGLCSGYSETLGVESDPKDDHIIRTYDHLFGINF